MIPPVRMSRTGPRHPSRLISACLQPSTGIEYSGCNSVTFRTLNISCADTASRSHPGLACSPLPRLPDSILASPSTSRKLGLLNTRELDRIIRVVGLSNYSTSYLSPWPRVTLGMRSIPSGAGSGDAFRSFSRQTSVDSLLHQR